MSLVNSIRDRVMQPTLESTDNKPQQTSHEQTETQTISQQTTTTLETDTNEILTSTSQQEQTSQTQTKPTLTTNIEEIESSPESQILDLGTEPVSKTRVNSVVDFDSNLPNNDRESTLKSQPHSPSHSSDHSLREKEFSPFLEEDLKMQELNELPQNVISSTDIVTEISTTITNEISEQLTTQDSQLTNEVKVYSEPKPKSEEMQELNKLVQTSTTTNEISKQLTTQESPKDSQLTNEVKVSSKPKPKSEDCPIYQKIITYGIRGFKSFDILTDAVRFYQKPDFNNFMKLTFDSTLLGASIYGVGWLTTAITVASVTITNFIEGYESALYQAAEAGAWMLPPFFVNMIPNNNMIKGYSVKTATTNIYLSFLLPLTGYNSYKKYNALKEDNYGSKSEEYEKESYEIWLERTEDILHYAKMVRDNFPQDTISNYLIEKLTEKSESYKQEIERLQSDAEKNFNYYNNAPSDEYKKVDVTAENTSIDSQEEVDVSGKTEQQNHDEI